MTLGLNPSKLLAIESMPQVRGLEIPEYFYMVTCEPAPLAGMKRPSSVTPWKELYRNGFSQVVCLTEIPPDYQAEPLIIAGHYSLQDLCGGNSPVEPELEHDHIRQVAGLVTSLITHKIGVVVHCASGTGRTGTVIGCVLRGLGYNTSDILAYLDQINRMRGARNGWPESPWQAQMIRNYIIAPVNRG